MLLDRSAKYYREHPTARRRHQEYLSQFEMKPNKVKKQVDTRNLTNNKMAIASKK